jgi:hypothetical protein
VVANNSGETTKAVGGVALFCVACGATASLAAASAWPLVVFVVIALAVAKVGNDLGGGA